MAQELAALKASLASNDLDKATALLSALKARSGSSSAQHVQVLTLIAHS
jgi:hypothetical protein